MPRKKGVGTEVAVPTRSSGRLRSSGRTSGSTTNVPSRSRTQSSTENVPVPVTKTPAPAPSSSSVYKKFPDRLHWKMTHFQLQPTTSTPKVDFNSRKVTRRDIDTAFGFNDSTSGGEGNYSTLISPIAHTSPSNNPPVWKIHPLTQRNVELDAPKTINPPEDKAASSRSHKSPVNVIQRTKKTTKKPRSKAKPLKVPELFEDIDDKKEADDEVGDGISPFSQLMDRYVVKREKQDIGLHVDPKKVLRTYGSSSRKRVKVSEDRGTEYDFELPVNVPPTEEEADPTPNLNGRNIKKAPSRTRRKKVEAVEDEAKNELNEIKEDEDEYKPDKGDRKTRRAPRKLKKKKEEDELDEETKRWLEEKNKEFEDVLKTPLVIENSFSD